MWSSAPNRGSLSWTKRSQGPSGLAWLVLKWVSMRMPFTIMTRINLDSGHNGPGASLFVWISLQKSFSIMKRLSYAATTRFLYQNFWLVSVLLDSTYLRSARKSAGLSTFRLLMKDTLWVQTAELHFFRAQPASNCGNDSGSLSQSMLALDRLFMCTGFTRTARNFKEPVSALRSPTPRCHCQAARSHTWVVSEWSRSSIRLAPTKRPELTS